MACMRLWPFIGLNTYMVDRLGTSKPVSHMSTTMAILRESESSLNLRSISFLCVVPPHTSNHSSGSWFDMVITTPTLSFHSGRSSMIL